ncbi:hypothetical protein FIBSPDRAFT_722375 [Athelia psychrophila]|uniref:YMC020W-like alpha/beta hydrolase domain-containing protein n=1 Tax=Athelia psychrophila TaxID=1759441 RepID=A0A166VH47_9AGAM|nr:hypothetical protein FIBSPDRAFT_722375 [Fibularhizoctonia sp. CBS 109695]
MPATNSKARSVLSSGTIQSQGSTTWYTPWNWYNNAPEECASGSGTTETGQTAESEGKTESELVKEEALARDPIPTIEVTSSSVSSPSIEPPNPIESGISANRVGWASFFSSTSLLVKSIKDVEKRDENGMEVMDIDDDIETLPSGAASPAVIQPAVVPKPKSAPAPKELEPKRDSATNSGTDGQGAKDGKSIKPPASPLTNSDSVKRETAKATKMTPRTASPSPSTKSNANAAPKPPNLVLPTWTDTFHTVPRSIVPVTPASTISKTLNYMSGVLFQGESARAKGKGKAKRREKELKEFEGFGLELPKAFDVLGKQLEPDVLQGCKRAVIIGIHGWFPGAVIKTVLGEPTGTSGKFVDMMLQALDAFQDKHDVRFKKITKIPLEGEGTINKRVDKLYKNLLANKEWIADLHAADVIFVATHSQGSVVSTHLMDRLIRDGHIRTSQNIETAVPETSQALASGSAAIAPTTLRPQRLCCLALCGIHLGPLRYLSTSSLLQPYFQYFESAAARELFEFQDTESEVSKQYVKALANVLHHKTKMVYVASLNDQVVPIYSGLFTTASHPLILRAMYIDGDAYQSSDFLSNLIVLLLRVMNAGISDSGLLAHLSEATAGSLNGIGHSTAYEELSTYSLAVDYCFLTTDGTEANPELVVEAFDAKSEQNDYEIPWALRDVIADERVAYFYSNEIIALREAFRDWHPKTTILREIKKKLQPIQRLPSSFVRAGTSSGSASKL